MIEKRSVYFNGEFVGWEKATVHIMSHSFARGSAIFEVISFHAAATGPVVFRLQDHVARLFRSAELLDMELPLAREQFYKAVAETIKRNGLQQGAIKIVCFYPQIAFDISPPQKRLDVSIFVIDPSRDIANLEWTPGQDTTACLSRWRKLDPQTVPVEAKAAANYLNGMMAYAEASRRGFKNVVMLDTQGFIAEGGTESIFLVKDGRLMTPALGTVLKSITRKSVLQAAEAIGIETLADRLPPELLSEATELFFSCSPVKVLPVRQFEERKLKNVPGPLTRRLSEQLEKITCGKDPRFNEWLYPVN